MRVVKKGQDTLVTSVAREERVTAIPFQTVVFGNDSKTAMFSQAPLAWLPAFTLGMTLLKPFPALAISPEAVQFLTTAATPFEGTNRTVTCDNWFTTTPLLTRMLDQPFNMSVTGTIRKNKREIPMEMKLASKYPPETKFCQTKDITLLSHTPKKNKIILVASTYLHTQEITDGKPNFILHYNDTKGGMDTLINCATPTQSLGE
ncbi:hypothetical protein J437_LFUL018817 [Ladona fulva]|uniref:PiggyBac transposable element-derived protein domain-containing protein n=1 Tax=Ladona fulva TaxID=123851 RepID=A0A8K0KQH7_LADFU|nr:hypothetical protein J437_LFUL018817 [Ladona fulva]